MKARTPTSGPGSSRAGRRALAAGFTLIELLLVVALAALVASLAGLALRDPSESRLQEDAARLVAVLEGARAEARASGLAARFELRPSGSGEDFRLAGLPPGTSWPSRWLHEGVQADIVGGRFLSLGPEPMIGAQRIRLTLGERRLTLATDGLGPFELAAEDVAQ